MGDGRYRALPKTCGPRWSAGPLTVEGRTMTSDEWLASTDPAAMLEFLCDTHPRSGQPTRMHPGKRKLRLFACACCRLWPEQRQDDTPLGKIEALIERGASEAEYLKAHRLAGGTGQQWAIYQTRRIPENHAGIASLLRDIIGDLYRKVELQWVKGHLCRLVERVEKPEDRKKIPVRLRRHVTSSTLVEEIWQHVPWLTPAVLPLAHAAYDLRRPDGSLDPVRLYVLADALEEAGCSVGQVHEFNNGGIAYWWNQAFPDERHLTPDRAAEHPLLAHLRSPGPHVRGCWAVDTLTGRQ